MRRAWIGGLLAAAMVWGCAPDVSDLRETGIRQFEVGHKPKAAETFKKVLARRPSDPEALYYMGRLAHDGAFYVRAEYYYESCLDMDPSHEKARLWLVKLREDAARAGVILQSHLP